MTPLAHQLPHTIKIGCYSYTIELQDDAWCEEHGCMGLCDHHTKTIIIVDMGCDGTLLNTFLHELLHAIYHLMDLKGKDGEEKTVTQLTTGLLMLYKDNPGLIQLFNYGDLNE